MRGIVIGEGAVGLALWRALRGGIQRLSARQVYDSAYAFGDDTVLIHAGGPAGDRACRSDPAGAFAIHYTLTQRLAAWSAAGRNRHLVLLNTVAPDAGFYAPMKRAACAAAIEAATRARGGHLLVLDCGTIVGPMMPIVGPNVGVVGAFLYAALSDGELAVEGTGEQTIRVTPIDDLVRLCLAELTHCHDSGPDRRGIVSPSVSVNALAATCAAFARTLNRKPPPVVYRRPTGPVHSYEDTPARKLTVTPLDVTLRDWARSVARERVVR